MHIDVIARRLVFVIASTSCWLLGNSVAIADAHGDRQAVMQANKSTVGVIDALVIGILNSNKVKEQAGILIDNGAKIAKLFAPGTDQNDPAVKPEAWSDMAGFKAADDKFINDAKLLMGAPDRIGFATALVTVQADCTACHQAYRVPPAPAAAVAKTATPAAQVVATATQAPANRAAASANQASAFVDRTPATARAVPTVKLKEPSVALETDAAQIAARSGSRNIQRLDDIYNRAQRAINCLEGPAGADFDPSALNPCAASGNGVIPDTADTARKAKFQDAVVKLKSVLATTDRTQALQGNLDAADMIVAASGN